MKIDERITQRLTALEVLGGRVLETRHTGGGGSECVDGPLAAQWVASARNLLANVLGRDSSYYENFKKHTGGQVLFYEAERGHGVVVAAQADYLADGIFKVRSLVEAEVFGDFLEQAEHLLANGYFQAAAVVAGCVLEDALLRGALPQAPSTRR